MTLQRGPVAHLFADRLREFWREPGVLFWTFGFPILLVVVLGLAFRSSGPESLHVAVAAGPGAEEAKGRLAAVAGLAPEILPEAEARTRLARGSVAALVVPGPSPRLVLDPSQPNARIAALAVRGVLERGAEGTALGEEIVTARGERYVDFLLPGLLGMTLLNGGAWGVGYGLVLLRTRKLLKRFAATPLRRSDLLLAYLLFRVVLALVESAALIAFGALFFEMRVSGSALGLFLLVLTSALSFGGLGLLAGARAENPQTGAGWVNLVTLPMLLVSGVFFSADKFPSWTQPLVQALPLTRLNDGLRAVLNEGAPLAAVGGDLVNLALWGLGSFLLALRVFRWT